MKGFADIHSHFLYGLDDGAKTKADMESMLDAAYENGIRTLYATPHVVLGVYPFDEALYQQRIEAARAYCRQKQYPICICTGAELMYTPALNQYAIDGNLPVLGNSDHVLIEFSPDVSYDELCDAAALIGSCGYTVVLAHAERYPCLYRGNRAARLRREHNVQLQVNCGSVIWCRGFFRRRMLNRWFRLRLIDCVASDAHDSHVRPMQMKQAHEWLSRKYGEAYAAELTGRDSLCQAI